MSRSTATLSAGAQVLLDDYPADLCWSPDGRYVVVAGGEGHLQRVSAEDASVLALGSHEPGLLAVSWQPGGKVLATSGQDGSVRLWDGLATTTTEGRVVHRGMAWPLGLSFDPRGKRLAFAVGRTVHLLDVEGTPVGTLGPHAVQLSQLAWRNADELLVAGNGALFTDRISPELRSTQHLLDGGPLVLVISADGRIAATGQQDGQVNFRFLATQKRSRMSGYDGKVTQATWSANSRWLATAATGSGEIVVWDFSGKGPEGTEPLQLKAHQERVESLAFAPVGPWLASGGRDWRLGLWRPGPSQHGADEPVDMHLLDGPVGLLRWSRDGRRLAVAQADGRLRFYSLQD